MSRPLAVALALALTFCGAAAQQPAPANGSLSLSSAIEKAKTYEARFQAAEAGFRANREILDQTRGLLLPEVSGTINRTRNQLDAKFGGQSSQSLDYYSGGASITLRQPLYRPESWARYQQAKAEVTRLEATLSSDRNRLMVEVAAAYLEALRALSEFRSYESQQKSQQGQAAAAARGVPLGLISPSERDERQARAELASLRALQAEAKLTEARRQLEKMVGQPVNVLLSPQDAGLAADGFAVAELPQWLEKASAASPEVRAARAAVDVAREGVRRAKAGHKPTVDIVAGRSKSTSESFSAINNTYYNSSVGVQLTVPIYSGGRVNSAVRQAVAEQEKAQAQLDQALRETAVLVEREHLTVRQAVQRLKAHDALVQSAQQNLLGARQGVQRGSRSQLDVLEAQGLLDSAQFERAGARLELLAARMRLQSLAGEIDDQTVTQLDRLLVQPVNLSR